MRRGGPPAGAGRLGLAQLGGCLAYVPLFGLLLPRRALAIDPAQAARLLSAALVAGALTASLAHIAAGRLGDAWVARHGNRRGLIAGGAASTALALALIGQARGPLALIGAVVLFQLALNLLLAPLAAVLADHVDHARKGVMAAVQNMALPLAGLGTAALARAFPVDQPAAFVILGLAVAGACLPLLGWWPFATAPLPAGGRAPPVPLVRRDLAWLLLARLLVQAGAAFVIGYLFLFLAHRLGSAGASALVRPLALAATGAVVVALPLLGWWSDRAGRRRPPMIAAALGCAAAVLALAWPAALVPAYCAFQVGLAGYLALDAALVAQLLGGHPARGRVLGYMNLSNTLPSVLVPGLVGLASLAPGAFAWTPALALAAACPLIAALVLARAVP